MRKGDVTGRRIGAALLDILILAVIFTLVGVLFGDASAGDGEASVSVEGASALLFALIVLVYYFAGEATSGQTLGKRAFGIRVVGEDGKPATVKAVFLRTILRPIDSLPIAYLLGLIVMLSTGERRARLGDLVGKTRVTGD